MTTRSVEKSILLECDVERAFTLFTEHASEWWPSTRRHTPGPHSNIAILATGRFFERDEAGNEAELGRVTLWEPPHRLVLDFYIGTDAEHPTEVTITFTPEGDGTRVRVVHGPKPISENLFKVRAPAYQKSWSLLLEALAAFTTRNHSVT